MVIRENHIEISIMDNLFTLHQELREDYYIISSIKNIISDGYFFILDDNLDKEKKEEIINRKKSELQDIYDKVEDLIYTYNQLENLMREDKTLEEVAITLVDGNLYTDSSYEYNFIILNSIIKLSEEMQGMILKILSFIIDFLKVGNEKLSKFREETKTFYENAKIKDSLNYCLNRSVNEDRIINYQLILSKKEMKDKENIKEFKKLSEKLGSKDKAIIIKKNDFSHNINYLKMKLTKEYEYTEHINAISRDVDRNMKMENFNECIFILTFIAPIIAIISIFPIIKSIKNAYGVEFMLVFILTICIIGWTFYSSFRKFIKKGILK